MVLLMEQLEATEDLFCTKPISLLFHDANSDNEPNLTEETRIAVAPHVPNFDPDQLSIYAGSLAKMLNAVSSGAGEEWDGIKPPKLSFSERIGILETKTTSTVTAINPEALKRAGIAIGEIRRVDKVVLERKITVYVFPDELSARIACAYGYDLAKQLPVKSRMDLRCLDPNITGEQLEYLKANQEATLQEALAATEALAKEK